jgi:uncharacterized NAD-dependent epimerase/dehydratase family protein
MAGTQPVQLRPPYLVFVGDQQNPGYAKTGFGLVDWCGELVTGQLRLREDAVDLGVPDLGLQEAVDAGANSLLIGVAPVGGSMPDEWWQILIAAAEAGLDIVSGLHSRLVENAALETTANESGTRLIDVRVPPKNLSVGTGRKRTGKRVLTVGTDCAVGKKYSTLALNIALRELGTDSTFRATGQTGIMIAGKGIAIDAVVSDFVSGAAELISPDNDPDHWDVIEGQGSIFHPGYAGVSLGLLHGSQPDAIVICHDATRLTMLGWPDYATPSVAECMELNLDLARRTNPFVSCAGICVNTSKLSRIERHEFLRDLMSQTELPCVDPVVDGCAPIARLLTGK